MSVVDTVAPFGTIAHTPAERQRDALLKILMTRRVDIRRRQNYYDGRQPLPTAPDKTGEMYDRLAEMGQANVTSLVVDAKTERMTVAGVRTSNEPAGDVGVWRDYWQANNLDEESSPLHDKVLTVGRAFVIVWPNPDPDNGPAILITPEDPSEVIVAYRPGSRRERIAALKVYDDAEAGLVFATLWLPDEVHFWRALRSSWRREASTTRWEPWNGPDDDGPVATNEHGIPVVEFRCRPTLTGQPNPEVSDSVIRVQDRINKTIFDRLVLSEFQAYPQRYAIGVEEDIGPDGQPMNPLRPGPQRVWTFEGNEDGPPVQIGQLAAADMSPHLAAVAADIDILAATSKVPAYYLAGKMSNISGDTIRADDAGLVAVVRKHIRVLEGAWEEVLRIAMAMNEDTRADDVALELVWRDPENRSMAEAVDAATKKSTLGIPFEQICEDIGYSPQKIATMAAMREADRLLAPSPPAPVIALPAVAGGGGVVPDGPTGAASPPPPAFPTR